MSQQVSNIDEILRAWLLFYDGRCPKENKERRKAFIILLENLKNNGYGKEELGYSVREKIVSHCVNHNHYSKQKLRNWIKMVTMDLVTCIDLYYGTIEIKHEGVITPEIENKLEGMDRKEKENTSSRETNSTQNEGSTEESVSSDDLDSEIKRIVEESTKLKEELKPITDEIRNAVKYPQIIWDEDFKKNFEDSDE